MIMPMKTIFFAILLLVPVSSIQAKMISKVDLTKIHSVKVEDDKIVIIGDGVFQSRMVTTEEGKDSNFVIQGQPSIAYKAQGHSVKFVITSHKLLKIPVNSPKKDHDSVKAYNQQITQKWKRSVELAKQLKKGEVVSFAIKGEEVILRNGRLVSVSGSGSIPNLKENKAQ